MEKYLIVVLTFLASKIKKNYETKKLIISFPRCLILDLKNHCLTPSFIGCVQGVRL
jgi:hypothetical protein